MSDTAGVRFNTELRGWVLSQEGFEVVKGGIAFRHMPTGVEVETGYSMGEVRLKVWDGKGQSLVNVSTYLFTDAGLAHAKASITAAIEQQQKEQQS